MATINTSHPKIVPCLWFDGNAEAAVKYYTSVFKNSKILSTSYSPAEGSPLPEGTILTITFQLAGQKFTALNGGPAFKFTEAVSFMVYCDTQKEIDYYWDKLSKGGAKVECGWVKDKFGLSWQIVPAIFEKMITDKDSAKAARALQAIWKMKKLEIEKIKKAYAGK
jgi:predicted 3-demethylubiquinone-9 3-methyltransferase (glyoxalase superfamily)